MLNDLLDGSLLLLELLHLKSLATSPGLLDIVLVGLLSELNVLDAQLLADNVQITDRINVTLDVDNLSIVEATNDLEDGIDGTDVRQEGVTQTSTSRGTTGQTSNVVDGEVSRDLGLGLVVLAQPVEALVGDEDARLFGLDGGIGEVGRVTEVALGNGLEERGLADVGETDLRSLSG